MFVLGDEDARRDRSHGDGALSARAGEARRARRIIALLSVAVIVLVGLVMGAPRQGRPPTASVLPALNATLNATAAVLLSAGYLCIRRRRVTAHRACMLAAFAVSTAFLVTYLVHHAQVGSVRFEGPGWLRTIYLGLLVPHVVLAAAVVPLALTAIHRGWRGDLVAHRRIARVALPIWLFVSVSGVLVFALLYRPWQ